MLPRLANIKSFFGRPTFCRTDGLARNFNASMVSAGIITGTGLPRYK